MHELSIASSLLEKVLEERERHGGGRITEINLRVGKLSHIMPEPLEFAFQILAKDTAAEKARINIERVPVALKCRTCGWEGDAAESSFDCARCKSSDVEIAAGMELVLASFTLDQEKPPEGKTG